MYEIDFNDIFFYVLEINKLLNKNKYQKIINFYVVNDRWM